MTLNHKLETMKIISPWVTSGENLYEVPERTQPFILTPNLAD